MLRTRTKVLLGTSLLAPVADVVGRWTVALERQRALEGGAWAVWVDPAPIFPILFAAGCLSFILALISLIIDIRRRQW
jgi:hypothetical protein